MDDRQALAIVSALADGANPVTGEVFAGDSPYQAPDIIRALFVAVRALEAQANVVSTPSAQAGHSAQSQIHGLNKATGDSDRKTSRSGQANAGKPWNAEEDAQLLAAFDRETPLTDIARTHGRTVGGVRARLEKHGRLEPSAATRWPNSRDATPRAAGRESSN